MAPDCLRHFRVGEPSQGLPGFADRDLLRSDCRTRRSQPLISLRVSCSGNTWAFVGEDFGDFQGASEALVSAAILAERATQKIAKILPTLRAARRMARRLRCISVAGHNGHAPSMRLGGGPFFAQQMATYFLNRTLASTVSFNGTCSLEYRFFQAGKKRLRAACAMFIGETAPLCI
jgi:hypothetical protein